MGEARFRRFLAEIKVADWSASASLSRAAGGRTTESLVYLERFDAEKRV